MDNVTRKLTIFSMFRNASLYVERFLDQIDAFTKEHVWKSSDIYLVLGYGDSTDGTGNLLYEATQFRFNAQIIEVNVGNSRLDKFKTGLQFARDAYVINRILHQPVAKLTPLSAFMDSRIVWEPRVLTTLINDMGTHSNILVHAPMVMALEQPQQFYDTWSFQRGDVRFDSAPPYHDRLKHDHTGSIIAMDSVGTFFLARSSVIPQMHYSTRTGWVGACEQVREHPENSGMIALNPTLEVYVP